ncbi:MAG: SIMPL domain-containing protein [Halioglobus sp.]|nr:SIMPL domain-containing protein [Halioglobus sp.]
MKRIAVGILAVLATIAAMSSSQAAQPEAQRQIVVSGQGSAAVAPDLAILSLTVMRDGATAREALSANSEAMAAVIDAMKRAGIAPKDLQTSGLSIQPRYSYPQRSDARETRHRGGSAGRTSPPVRVRATDDVGAILDQSVTMGVNEGGSVAFTNDDPAAVLQDARISAVADARRKAQTLARAAGVELGPVVHISEQSVVHRPQSMAMRGARMMAAEADAVPIEAGENTYRVNVHMTWAIAP